MGDICVQVPMDISKTVTDGAQVDISEPPPPVHPNMIRDNSLHTLAEEPAPLVSNPPSQAAPAREIVVKRCYTVMVTARQGENPLTGQNKDMPSPLQGPESSPGLMELDHNPCSLGILVITQDSDTVTNLEPKNEEEINVTDVDIKKIKVTEIDIKEVGETGVEIKELNQTCLKPETL